MAVALDSAGSTTYTAGTVVNLAHTISGADKILVVGISTNSASGGTVTFAGTALTSLGEASNGGANSRLLYLMSPPDGTGTITSTFSAPEYGCLMSASFTGVDTSGLDGTASAGGATQTGGTVNVVIGTANTLVVDCISIWDAWGPTPVIGTEQTQRVTSELNSYNWGKISSELEATAPGTAVMSWTWSTGPFNTNWATIGMGIAVKPAAPTGIAADRMTIGVGQATR